MTDVSALLAGVVVTPPKEVDRFVRTVIETADPALEPVAKLRRYVVKRVQIVTSPVLDRGRPSVNPPGARRAPPRRSEGSGVGE